MPDLRGKTKAGAEEKLATEGKTGSLDVQEIDCNDEGIKEGTVCRHTPEPGQTTQAGGPTVVYVQAKRKTKMPDVIGRTAEEAKQILAQAGFHEVEVRTLAVSRAGCTPKLVCLTSPEPGVRAAPQTPKTIFLQPEAMPAQQPSAETDADGPAEHKPKPVEEKPPESVF